MPTVECPYCHQAAESTSRICKSCGLDFATWIAAEAGRDIPGWTGPVAPKAKPAPTMFGDEQAVVRVRGPNPVGAAAWAAAGAAHLALGALAPKLCGWVAAGDVMFPIGGYPVGVVDLGVAYGAYKGRRGVSVLGLLLFLFETATVGLHGVTAEPFANFTYNMGSPVALAIRGAVFLGLAVLSFRRG